MINTDNAPDYERDAEEFIRENVDNIVIERE